MGKPVGVGMAKRVWLFRGAPILATVLFLEAYVFLTSFAMVGDSELYPFLAMMGPLMFFGALFSFFFYRPFTELVYAEIGWVFRILTLTVDEEEAAAEEEKLYREAMAEISASAVDAEEE